jgi:hypothetical protein
MALPAVIESSKLQPEFQSRVAECNKALASVCIGAEGPLDLTGSSEFEGEGLLILAFLTWLLTEQRGASCCYPTASLLVCKMAWLLAECGFSIRVNGVPSNHSDPKRTVELVTVQGHQCDPALQYVTGVFLPFGEAPRICRRGSVLLAIAQPYLNYGLLKSSLVERAWDLIGRAASLNAMPRRLRLAANGYVTLQMLDVQTQSPLRDTLHQNSQSLPEKLQRWVVNTGQQAWQLFNEKFVLDNMNLAPAADMLRQSNNGEAQAASTVLLIASILRLIEPFITFRGGTEAITACECKLDGSSDLADVVEMVGRFLEDGIHLTEWRMLSAHLWAGESLRVLRDPHLNGAILFSNNGITMGFRYLEQPGTSDEDLTQMVLYDAPLVNIGVNENGWTESTTSPFFHPRTEILEKPSTRISRVRAPSDGMTCTLEPIWNQKLSYAAHKYRVRGVLVGQISPLKTMLLIAARRVFCSCNKAIDEIDINERCLTLDPSMLYSKAEIPRSAMDLICYKSSASKLHSTFCVGKHWGERSIVAMDCLECAVKARHNRRERVADAGSTYVVVVPT